MSCVTSSLLLKSVVSMTPLRCAAADPVRTGLFAPGQKSNQQTHPKGDAQGLIRIFADGTIGGFGAGDRFVRSCFIKRLRFFDGGIAHFEKAQALYERSEEQ